MADSTENLTIQILRQIRDELVTTRTDLRTEIGRLGDRIDATNERLDVANERLGHVESTLLELAVQQRFLVRGHRALLDRDRRFEHELDDLRNRVDALEERLPGDPTR